MKASDLREKSVEDLKELGKSLASDVFQNRLKNFTNRLDDTSAIRKSRHDLARVITLLHEREAGIVRPAPVKAVDPPPAPDAAKAVATAEAKPKKTAAKKAKKNEAKEP